MLTLETNFFTVEWMESIIRPSYSPYRLSTSTPLFLSFSVCLSCLSCHSHVLGFHLFGFDGSLHFQFNEVGVRWTSSEAEERSCKVLDPNEWLKWPYRGLWKEEFIVLEIVMTFHFWVYMGQCEVIWKKYYGWPNFVDIYLLFFCQDLVLKVLL